MFLINKDYNKLGTGLIDKYCTCMLTNNINLVAMIKINYACSMSLLDKLQNKYLCFYVLWFLTRRCFSQFKRCWWHSQNVGKKACDKMFNVFLQIYVKSFDKGVELILDPLGQRLEIYY